MSIGTSPAPIALFVYDRPIHTRRTLQALAACSAASESDLTIFSDAAREDASEKKVETVRHLISNVTGFRSLEIITRPENLGSARSIIDGIETMLGRHERAIFIEDDVVCFPKVLEFLNRCLERYADQPNIFSVSAYNYPPALMPIPKNYEYDIYFSRRFFSWGWATWRRSLDYMDWNVSDYSDFAASASQVEAFRQVGEDLPDLLARQVNGKVDDWSLPVTFCQFRNNFLTVCPTRSLVDNIGHDGSGLHCAHTELFRNDFHNGMGEPEFPEIIYVDRRLLRATRQATSRSFARRTARKVMDMALKTRKRIGAS